MWKTLYLRCLKGLWIRLWGFVLLERTLVSKFYTIRLFLQVHALILWKIRMVSKLRGISEHYGSYRLIYCFTWQDLKFFVAEFFKHCNLNNYFQTISEILLHKISVDLILNSPNLTAHVSKSELFPSSFNFTAPSERT